MVIKIPCKPQILQFMLYKWSLGRALLTFTAIKIPLMEDMAPGSEESPLVTPVLLSLLGVKEMVLSFLEVLGLCSAIGFRLDI